MKKVCHQVSLSTKARVLADKHLKTFIVANSDKPERWMLKDIDKLRDETYYIATINSYFASIKIRNRAFKRFGRKIRKLRKAGKLQE